MTRKQLEDLGLTKEVIDSIMTQNGQDVENARKAERATFDTQKGQLNDQINDLQGQIQQRDTDLAALNDQLEAAKTDAGALENAKISLANLQTQYDTDKQNWEAKTQRQAYEFAVKTEVGKLKFSSSAAQREFQREAIDKGFKMEGDKLLGFNDYVASYRENDPSAFAAEPAEPTGNGDAGKQPTIVMPSGGASAGTKKSAPPTLF